MTEEEDQPDLGPYCPCCGTGAQGLEIIEEFFDTLDPVYGFKGKQVQKDLSTWAKQIRNKQAQKDLLIWAKQIRDKQNGI
jgi:hypothetical protein